MRVCLPTEKGSVGCRQLFSALDRCEETLGKQRYLTGDTLTEADVRLFQTLIRFDVVYVVRIIFPERNRLLKSLLLHNVLEASWEGTCVHEPPSASHPEGGCPGGSG